MQQKLTYCLWFNDQAEAAAKFYCSVFEHASIKNQNPMVTEFELLGTQFIALNGGPTFEINPSISFYVQCDTEEKVNAYWDKLIVGGSVMMPLDAYDWSKKYGWLKDKYGLTWQITLSETAAEMQQIMPSLLFTGKLFGRAEAAVKFYTQLFNGTIDQLFHYPPGTENDGKILFSKFNINGESLIAMDGPGEHAFNFNEGVSLILNCDNQQEIDKYWELLTKDGSEENCGWLKDQFSVSWQVIPAELGAWMSDPEKAQKVVAAFMPMKKMDIATLKNAAMEA